VPRGRGKLQQQPHGEQVHDPLFTGLDISSHGRNM
jgi:hypothetical protein